MWDEIKYVLNANKLRTVYLNMSFVIISTSKRHICFHDSSPELAFIIKKLDMKRGPFSMPFYVMNRFSISRRKGSDCHWEYICGNVYYFFALPVLYMSFYSFTECCYLSDYWRHTHTSGNIFGKKLVSISHLLLDHKCGLLYLKSRYGKTNILIVYR